MRSVRNLSLFPSCFSGFWLALGPTLQGATRTAASLSAADVQAAVDAAADGDTVKLPAGTATWTACVKVAGKYVTVTGAGIDKTTITGGIFPANSTLRVFEIGTKKGGLTRLCNLTIDGGNGPRDGDNKGMLTVDGDSTTWHVDHLRIRATRTCAMYVHACRRRHRPQYVRNSSVGFSGSLDSTAAFPMATPPGPMPPTWGKATRHSSSKITSSQPSARPQT